MLGATPKVNSTSIASGLAITVAGSERELAVADLRRLFPRERLTPPRRERLARLPRVLVTCGTTIVGVAVYEHVAGDLRVHEFAVDRHVVCDPDDVALALLRAIDLAGVAGGDRRIVVTPRAGAFVRTFRDCGYDISDEGCAGRWLHKALFGSAFELPPAG
jgi:hypothetical protein